ncbi:DUF3343 domain-containing protein [Oscillibacter sp.]|uniref:DUF3343 domain-containing protein n=1 Tax=Oscillibacter sp. TaxID=1945593 RepID=UPI00289AB80F|nr:DUF3343 domain-containing protein [Oscillibacter sp.]
MEQYWMIARSVTYAQRMERILMAAGIRTRIFRAPRDLSNLGCAYAVEVTGGALRPALSILRSAGLYPAKLYLLQQGKYVEISL